MIRPPHAYVPGRTARHPDDLFDAIKASVTPGMTPEDLQRSAAFTTGLRYLEDGFFWEAHEVFEPIWLALPGGTDERAIVQALIQLANARLKTLMGRPRAALRLYGIVSDICSGIGAAQAMGQSVSHLDRMAGEAVAALKNKL